MLVSPVIAPKPQRLLSPKMKSTGEKKLDSVKSFEFFSDHNMLTPGSHEACREVERIMHAETEPDQKSPLRPKPSYPQPMYVQPTYPDAMYSPPFRTISPPARAQNPQAAAAEAYWREHREITGTKQEPSHEEFEFSSDHDDHDDDDHDDDHDHGHDKDDHDKDEDTDATDLQVFRHSLPLTSHHLSEPSSPFSAPPSLPSLELTRHISLPYDRTPNRSGRREYDEDELDMDESTILLSPNIYESLDKEEQDRIDDILTPPLITDYYPYHLPLVNNVNYECQHSPHLISSRPIDIPSRNRGNSVPSRISSSLSTSLSSTPTSNSSKRKRGKPGYASRSLPSQVSMDLLLQITRAVRTQSDAR